MFHHKNKSHFKIENIISNNSPVFTVFFYIKLSIYDVLGLMVKMSQLKNKIKNKQ